mgnify:CR=1 FL=1
MRMDWRYGAVLLLAMGCKRSPVPSPAGSDTAGIESAPAATASAPMPSATAKRPAPQEAQPSAPPASSATPAPVGGLWLSCYSGFTPRSDPKLDVMRLGVLCGPQNGMSKLTEAREAKVQDGGPGQEHPFDASPGECFRIFAVAEPGVEDLDVEVLSPSQKRIAFDTSDDRWPVVKPDGPFCVSEAGSHRARVRAQRGGGRYAIEIWRLR